MRYQLTKYAQWLAYLIWIICIPLLIISSTAGIYSHSFELYKYGFNKYQINKVTGISEMQLEDAARKMIDYFYGRSDTPQIEVEKNGKVIQLYSQKEITHLADVQAIVSVFDALQILSIFLLLFSGLSIYFRAGVRKLLTGLKIGSMITVGFTGILIAWAVIDFNSLFYLFHIISFNNNLWILDPTRDYLIMMFPEGFFNDAALFIVITILSEAVILWIAAFVISKLYLPKKKV